MSATKLIVIYYLVPWGGARIRGGFRRWRQPLLRGPEWFFNVHVQSDFYTGAGKNILHRYWMRMLLSFAIEIPVAAAIFVSGRISLLPWLILAMGAFVH